MGSAGSARRPPYIKGMVSILSQKPSIFNRSEVGDTYYEMYDDAGPYGYACLNFFYPPVAILHVELVRFSHTILKKIVKTDWPYCVEQCHKNNCTIVSVDKEGELESNRSWIKFVRHFGFERFTQYTASVQILKET